MAAFDFSADDIFKLAEEIEVNGEQFYRKAAEDVSAPQEKDMLSGLADMEKEHKRLFEQMRSEFKEKEKSQTVFDPEGEAENYLKALADIRVFFEKPIDTSSMKNILKAAIQAEKDSIVLYIGMKELVPEKYGRNRIENIIKEEMGHIRQLSRELAKLKK
ncbi:MAG: ferritin family protein [Desulfobacteraceae bacterium]|nr:ferritin family protein [Desulfobacteraceae bacterium]MCF8095650.1 ferritin family protein [Desulfobacteraceae bacterium]